MSSSRSDQECRLLLLPPELRIEIFETAYTVTRSETRPLFQLDGLPWQLLLTCRQIYKEAFAIYKEAHHAYWSQATLVEDRLLVSTALHQLKSMRDTDLRLITSIRIAHEPDEELPTITTYKHGVWRSGSPESCTWQGVWVPEFQHFAAVDEAVYDVFQSLGMNQKSRSSPGYMLGVTKLEDEMVACAKAKVLCRDELITMFQWLLPYG